MNCRINNAGNGRAYRFRLLRRLSARRGNIFTVSSSAAVFVFIVMALASMAIARDVVFWGLTDKKGESAQANVEQAIRHELLTNPNIKLISEVETHRIIREKERLGRSRTEFFIPPSAGLADSTIVINGIIENFSINIKRSMLLWGKIDARITVKLYFNEVAGPATYQGEFVAVASKKKDLLLFANAEKTVHVSAKDRSELMGMMQADIVKKVSDFATLFFNSLATGPIHQASKSENEETAADSSDAEDTDN